MSLRITILTLIACLLIATVGTIGGLGYYFTKDSVEDLRDQYLQAVSEGTAKGIDELIQTAQPLLSSINIPRDLKPEITPQEMAFVRQLEGHVKTLGELTYLDYGDQQTGHYIAIRRDESGELIFNRAHPQVDSGHEFEWSLSNPDEISPLPQPQTPPYDPRTRDWYKIAAEKGFAWTKPYAFFSGGRGISASLPIKAADGSLRGVMSLAISLDRLAQYLKSLRKNSEVEIFILLQDGTIVTKTTDQATAADAALSQSIKELGNSIALLSTGTTVVTETENNQSYSVTFYTFKRAGSLLWSIAVVIPEKLYLGVVQKNTILVMTAGLLALMIALGAGFFISDGISTPLRKISADLENVAQFKLSNQGPITSFIQEIAVVGDSVARMKAGLRSFSRYVPHEEVRKILASGSEITLGGEIRTLSLHFSDLANFSGFSERLSPTEVVQNLAEYLEILTEILHSHEGTIVQYTGDGLFAFFNAPILDPQHASHAVGSALAIRDKLEEVNVIREKKGQFQFINRVGLHSADVVVGNIGTEEKVAYSAIGDGVNLASRLEGLNKVYGTRIIASANLKALTGDTYYWRLLDKVAVVGRVEPTLVYEPIGLIADVTEQEKIWCENYESALTDYFNENFKIAADKFRQLNDFASKAMLRRCETFLITPPKGEWKGVFSPAGK